MSEFPQFGDKKRNLLPIYIDPESSTEVLEIDSPVDAGQKIEKFWMPDKMCKVCYGCEIAFSMYRRRHHCRMCGQVFCNPCSAHFIDGSLINLPGLVRSCQLCHDQLSDRVELEAPHHLRRRQSARGVQVQQKQSDIVLAPTTTRELVLKNDNNNANDPERIRHASILQNRASAHLEAIVQELVQNSTVVEKSQQDLWISIILNLVRDVVSSVDPNVRRGDCMDIRPYVAIKMIPGGSMIECCYVDGVVFRKNVSQKKMTLKGSLIPLISSRSFFST